MSAPRSARGCRELVERDLRLASNADGISISRVSSPLRPDRRCQRTVSLRMRDNLPGIGRGLFSQSARTVRPQLANDDLEERRSQVRLTFRGSVGVETSAADSILVQVRHGASLSVLGIRRGPDSRDSRK